jgi:hypothetical protein
VCHNYCLETPIEWIPEEDFYCAECCTRLNLKNDFAQPQEFNAELYEQIVNAGQPPARSRQRREETQNQRNMRRTRRRENSDDEEFGTYQPRRRHHFRFRNGVRQEEEAVERPANVPDNMTQPQDRIVPVSSSRFNTRRSESTSMSEDEAAPTNRVSRTDRLRLRQQVMENGRAPAGLKYKPSPKKEPKDLRGQWRRIRRITRAAEQQEQESWRLFNKEDVNSHENVTSLLQLAKCSTEFIDPVERHKRLENGLEKPRFYDRQKKMAVDELPHIESDEEIEEVEDSFYEEEQSEAVDSEEESLHSEHYSGSEEEDVQLTDKNSYGISVELDDDSEHKPAIKQTTRAARQIQKYTRPLRNIVRNQNIQKPKQKVNLKQNLTKRVALRKIKQSRIIKTQTKQTIVPINLHISKRMPKKVIDFDFDNSGKKVVVIEKTSQINKQNLIEMPAKVAGKSQTRKDVRPSSKSVAKSPKPNRSVSRPQQKAKAPLRQQKTSKIVKDEPAQIQERSNIKKNINSKAVKASKDRNTKDSQSPVKGGISNLFKVNRRALKPLSKKEAKNHHEEYMKIRNIAERTDARENRGIFKFGFMKGPKPPAQKFVKERSREKEKYVSGQPIKHSLATLGNLSMLTYSD